jgi:DNA polymerase III epsilon subunit-like protein
MAANDIEYYIIDTETTGLKCEWHQINQFSVIRLSTGKQLSVDIKVDNPERASPQALEIQGKIVDDLDVGIPLKEAIDIIDAFFEEDGKTRAHRCIYAHNAPFDRKFCHAAWKSCDKEFPADLWLCTKQYAQLAVKKHGLAEKIAAAQGEPKVKFGLNNFLIGIGITPKIGAHSAEIDAINTVDLVNWLVNSKTEYVALIKREPHTLSNLITKFADQMDDF